ncbi:phosphoribosylamine--glycine ligase [uncultured Amnibacterium sp.]|uniref:phosphoribosylamine--glycine ligase n=1 Tax=uncultured Amnibacterium sp. TaxID=1631851 RepID=UPI0035CC0DD9
MRVLILGSGAREHAIALALTADDEQHELIAAPGNAGIARLAELVTIDPGDPGEVAEFALSQGVELVVVGPEAPLLAGVADALRERGVPVFGPGRAAAAIEGSKAFAKRVMAAAGVPTGKAVHVGTAAEAEAALESLGSPYVVKADGLAAGKGVLVTEDREAARAHAAHWLEAGPILVEQHLAGREVSLFFVCDGDRVVPLAPAQDAKRLGDGDTGPNTGGMGAYSPLPWLAQAFGTEAAFVDIVQRSVAEPVVRQLAVEGTPFVGLLYCGLIVHGTDVRVIEFNARFGDPETQVVLPRLRSPFGALLAAAAGGALDRVPPPVFGDEAAVAVVLAGEGYPVSAPPERPLHGLDEAEQLAGVTVLHAATAERGSQVVATGGRVLSVVGTGAGLLTARERAYAGIDRIRLQGGQLRRDIAEGLGQ